MAAADQTTTTTTPGANPGGVKASHAGAEVPFGVNAMRLSGRQWLATLAVVAVILALTPWLWTRLERFPTGPDYRIPYELSKDYWLYGRRIREHASSSTKTNKAVYVIGDSVVWGEYVLPDGTLSHFLNRQPTDSKHLEFVNAGVNGMFPLAMEGLVRHYAPLPRPGRMVLHANLLWMTSPKADLSTDKEETFNHARLVPQFSPWLACYRADGNERISATIQHRIPFLSWVDHLQTAYFDQKSVLGWTLADDGSSDPPRYPNSWKNPLARIRFEVPSAAALDPQRGPQSPRHKPWSASGAKPSRFEWVALEKSAQWKAFQRTVSVLRLDRGEDVLVVLGPFNEHMISDESRPAYRALRDGVEAWLTEQKIPHVVPEILPSELYADASHPLTEGYRLMAERLYRDSAFEEWLSSSVR